MPDYDTNEELNDFTNTVAAISAGDDGLWDFALIDNSAPAGTTYCFRTLGADDSLNATPIVVPEITTAVAANSAPTISNLIPNTGPVTLT